MMKKEKLHIAFLLTGLLTAQQGLADVKINATNFPDANFRSFVAETYDSNGDGTLSDDEISEFLSINVLQI